MFDKNIFDKLAFVTDRDKDVETYWLNKLVGNPGKTTFLYDNNRSGMNKAFTKELCEFRLADDLFPKLMKLSNNSLPRLHMILIAGLISLLYKYSGNKDIIVGTSIYKQEMEADFVNTVLALRVQLTDNITFRELLLQVKDTVIEAVENQNYPVELLLQKLGIPFSRDDNFPLFDVAILLENIQDKRYIQYINPNVFFSFLKTEEAIKGVIEYNSQLYNKKTMEGILIHFSHLLREVLFEINLPVEGMDILTQEEKLRLLSEYNDAGMDFPADKTIHELFERQVEKTPGNIAISEVESNCSLSYKELNEKTNRLAFLLREKGISIGKIVAVMGERSLEIVVGILGTLKAGAAYLPLDIQNPAERLKFILEDSSVYTILSQKHIVEEYKIIFESISEEYIIVIDDARIYKGKATNPSIENTPMDIAYIIYTSGSTGRPKGVLIKHMALVNYISWAARKYVKDEAVNFPFYTSISFDLTVTSIFTPLLTGNAIVVYGGRISEDLVGRIVDDNKVEVIKLTPAHLNLIRAKKIEMKTPVVKRFIVGGEILETQLACTISDNFNGNIEIYNEYGPTEAAVGCMLYRFNHQNINRRSVPIGIPAANTQIYLLDNGLQPVPIGAVGEIYISGIGVADGYLNRVELTSEKFMVNPFVKREFMYKTGDMATWLLDGNIEFLGRMDHQVKIRGFRIELGEIENQILSYEGIKEAVVIIREEFLEHSDGIQIADKTLCAYIVLEKELAISVLREYLSGKLPDYMIPTHFVKIATVPLTHNGKIDINALPRPEIKSAAEYIAPQNPYEEKIVEIWSNILRVERNVVGIDSDFFEMGGNSLKATIAIDKIHKVFNLKVPLVEFFNRATARSLAELMKELNEDCFSPIEPSEEKGNYKLSSSQKRLYILQQMDLDGTSYNVPNNTLLEGKLNLEKLENVFIKLIERHESFQTSFEMINGEPMQKIHKNVEFAIQHLDVSQTEVEDTVKNFLRPFDLSKAPLLRVGLVKLEEQRYILMVDMHHIISDGISMNIFIKEFMLLYRGEKLPPLRLQYRDYAEWRESESQREAVILQKGYWMKQFVGELLVLDLPTDFRRPLVQSFEGSTLGFRLSSEQFPRLKEFVQVEGVTLFMVLLAVYNIFLEKLSSREEIIVGTPVAGRRHADLQGIIGMFVNTLALKNHPAGEKTFKEFVKELRENTLEAFSNQDYQYEELVEHVMVKRDAGRNPLFDVMFALQNSERVEVDIEGIKLTSYTREHRTSKFDLNLVGVELEDGLLFTFEYSTKLFKRETIERFVKYLKELVNCVIGDQNIRIADIEIIPGVEKEQILYEFNTTVSGYPKDKTVHCLFGEQVDRTPDKVAVVLGEEKVTYRVLNERGNQLARRLTARGVRANSIVGLMVDRSVEMLIGIMGILKSGGAYLPIEVDNPEERKDYMVVDCNSRIAIMQQKYSGELEYISEKIYIEDEDIYRGETGNLGELNTSGDLIYIIYTSGSTGKPKGVMISHYNVVRVVKETNYIELTGEDRVLQLSNYAFDGSVFDIYGALLNGSLLVMITKEQVLILESMAGILLGERITVFFVTTALFNMLVELNLECLKGIKRVLFGGERVSVGHTKRAFEYLAKGKIVHMYGPTETTVYSTYYVIEEIDESLGTVPIGRPLANTSIYILDRHLKPVPLGTAGEIYVGGDGLARGYLNDVWLTRDRFIVNPFVEGERLYRTGDIGKWLVGGIIEFIGRLDHQVKLRGFRVELGEIESRLLEIADIKEAVVIILGGSIEDDKGGEKSLCAYYLAAQEYEISELRDILAQSLPSYMIPSYFIRLDRIPLTANGKVDMKALPRPELKPGGDYVAPRNMLEERLVEIWSEVLGVEKSLIGIDANFFELGGHSLKTMSVVSNIHKTLGKKIALVEVFKHQTIRELSKYIGETKEIKFADINPVEKKQYYALSSAQKRLYFLQQLDLSSISYNMPWVFPLGKGIEKNKLESTLTQLIARHESLRTSFVTVNEGVVQKIHPPETIAFSLDYYEVDALEVKEIIKNYIRPFDLSKAPLIRSGIIKLPDGHYVWIVDVHHIVSDGTSHTILTEDFMSLHGGMELAPLRLQYKDFAQWQNRLLESGEIKAQEDYWLKLYTGDVPRLNMSTDYKRPEVFTFDGDYYKFRLEKEDADKFKALASRIGGTLYMNMLAALDTLFYKYTGQTDIIIGAGIAGRRHVDLMEVVGMFVNTLAMRNYPDGVKSYESFLNEVIANSVKGFENQDVQFEELIDKLNLERDASRNPLFDIMMVVQNFRKVGEGTTKEKYSNFTRMEQLPAAGENFPDIEYRNTTSKFDMTFFVHEQGENVFINIEYYNAIFKRETIERFARHLKNVIKEVVSNPSIKLEAIEIIDDQEKKTLLFQFNDTETFYPRAKTIGELFGEQVARVPDNTAVVLGADSLTYRILDEESNRVANYLYYENKVRSGDRVGMLMDRSLDMMIVIFGILKTGGAYVPISPSFPGERIKTMIDDSGIRILISQKRYIKPLNRVQWGCRDLDTLLCIDSEDVHSEDEVEQSELMNRKLWEYVGETSVDEITGGGWNSSYTGEPIPKDEMDEYGDNILKKLEPLLNKEMRVLEIGAASGISMYRIAPKVGLYYGTDLSQSILEKNWQRIKEEGLKNIKLHRAAAHEIEQVEERDFDLIIINSVIQCFNGHNYLRKVIRKAIDLMGSRGYLFIGDIMDQELKDDLIADLVKFRQENRGKSYKTKTDWSEELFVSRSFWQDLALDYPEIYDMEFSGKIHTMENELTKFRYDGLFYVDKSKVEKKKKKRSARHKNQHDLKVMRAYDVGRLKVEVEEESGNLAYIIYTSGSTGIAKGTLTTHYNVTRVVKNTNYIEFKSGDRVLQLSDYAFDGSVFDIFGALLNGLPLVMVRREDMLEIETLCRLIKRERITVFFVTTALFNTIIDVGLESLSGIRKVLFGGERVSVNHAARALKYLGKDTLVHVYGPTETTVYATYYAIREIDENQITIPIGSPISNTSVYILDLGFRLMPIGVNGEIYIGGSGVCKGYLNNEVLTREKFLPNPYLEGEMIYRTGDLGRWLPDGNIEFNGRIDKQVKVRGYRIELGEIEKRVLSYSGIKECVVTASDDEKGSRYICAYLVVEEKVEIVELKDYLAQVLPDYMIPSYFVQIEAFPLKSTGKVDHAKLPDPRLILDGNFVAPRNEVERKMMEIWSEVLGIGKEMIGIGANFFELGGHSLKATVLISRIHKELNVKVPLAEVFKRQTIRSLSEYIGETKEIQYTDIYPVEEKEYYALSSAQKRLYFLQQFDLNSTSYNIPLLFPLGKGIEKNKLESILKQLIARHESLRTSFVTVNEGVVQKIHPPETVAFSLDYYEVDEIEAKEIIKNFIKPFDLSKAPLVRSGIVRLPDGHYVWMVDVHHIVSDGTSHTILTEDFMSLYRGMELAPLRLQYKDFAHWQNRLLDGGEIKAQEDYWLELYTGEIPRLNMATDYKRPEVFTFEGEYNKFMFEREEADKLKALASRCGGTLYMNMLAALDTLFYKYTGQTDIIIGSGIAGRRHIDLLGVVGMFVNTLAMRNYPKGEKSYEDFLKEVIANSVKGFENQDVQFEDLVDKLDLERDASRNPLFDIMVVVQNFRKVGEGVSKEEDLDISPVEQLPVPEENLPSIEYKNTSAKFDMTFYVYEIKEDVYLDIEYYRGIFKPETIQRIVFHLKNVINAVLKNPGIKLQDIDFISEEEKRQVLYDFNDTAVDYPRGKTIFQLFEEQAEKAPGRIVVVTRDTYITYRYLDEESDRLANYLYHENRVVPDQAVGIMMDRSAKMITAVLGILKAGGAFVPISPSYPEERIKKMINDARIKAFVSQSRYIKTLNRMQWECGANLETFLCIDSEDVRSEDESKENELMSRKLWEYVGETAVDEVTGGGWNSSYTGEPIPKVEMDEYGDNTLKKLEPLLHKQMRVLEIGAASGISMYRIAPKVGLYYGTDLSEVIIEKNRQRINEEGHKNIKLSRVAAHEIDRIEERDFDLIIINSVIQCFHGHNYLEKVIRKCIDLMAGGGYLFIGDIMDQDLKDELIADLVKFKQTCKGNNYRTKTDWSEELFISRRFLKDLLWDYPEIYDMEFSGKIHTIENELTKFRYDALIYIDKAGKERKKVNRNRTPRHKNQHDLRTLRKCGADKLRAGVDSDNLAYIMYTSGSTGIPKGVMVEHKNVVRLVRNTNFVEFKEGDRILQTGALEFDASTFEIWGVLLNGLTLVLESKENLLDAVILKEIIAKNKITMMWMTAPFFNQALDEDVELFRGIRNLLVGGEALSPTHINRVRLRFQGLKVINGYGPTENTTFSATYSVEKEFSESIPIGKPIANSTVYIVDIDGNLLPYGIPGELCVGGDGVSRGYLNDVELTGKRFNPLPYRAGVKRKGRLYRTGDYARWLPDGNIEFLGRIDSQVKIRGYRIEMREIENRLLKHAPIKEAVVIDRLDSSGSRYMCAYFVSDEEIEVTELRDILSRDLPEYMIPGCFIGMGKIPLTANGKVDRKALPGPEAAYIEGGAFAAPRDEIEKKLAGIWAEVLGRGAGSVSQSDVPGIALIGTDDNFFELGGHSLKATTLVYQVYKKLNVKMKIADVFTNPTIRGMAQLIKDSKRSEYTAIHPSEEKEYYDLSYAQQRLWILCQFEEDSTAYNMPTAIVIFGPFNNDAFTKAVQTLADRHESLRTVFILINGDPKQVIIRDFKFNLEQVDLRSLDEKTKEEKTRDIYREYSNRHFDLVHGPLFGYNAVRLEDEKYLLIHNYHHIINDGWSWGIINNELRILYNSYLKNSGNPLSPVELQYKDYARWHNQLIESGGFYKSREYWLEKFKDKPNGIELALDHPRRPVQTFNGGRVPFIMDREMTSKLRQLSSKQDATLFMSLLTLLNIFLYKFSGQKDILVGFPIAGRKYTELSQMVGFLVNTLVFRNELNPAESYIDLLGKLKQETLSCYEYQDYPFDLLIEELGLDRDLSQSPLFNVMLAHNNSETQDIRLIAKELTFSGYAHGNDFNMSKFDLTFFMEDIGDAVQILIEYNSDLFEHRTIERMCENFLSIVDSVIKNSETPISGVNSISQKQYEKVVKTVNETQDTFSSLMLQELFEDQVKKCGDKIAVVYNGANICYYELNRKSNQLAYYLKNKYDIKPNNVIGVSVDRSLDMIIILLGIIKSGAGYLAVDPTYPQERVLHVLGDSTADLLIIDKMRPELFGNYKGEILNIDNSREETAMESTENLQLVNKVSDILYVNYTSGSTGIPNGAMLSHDILANLIKWQHERTSIDSSLRCLQFTSINFCVSFQEIIGTLTAGGELHLIGEIERQDIDYLMDFLSERQVEVLFLPFSYLNFLFNESSRWNRSFKHNLKHIITAGEQLKITAGLKRFLDLNPGLKLHNHYGSTEMHVVTSYTVDASTAEQTPIPPAGKPISNVKIYILDEYNNPVPPGVWGELFVAGSSEILGYINNPALTDYKLLRHPELPGNNMRLYRTGDIGRWHEDGNIELRGRKDFQVKIRGFRVEPGEIEIKILSIERVRECVVVVREDSRLGLKSLAAYVVVEGLDAGEIKMILSRELPQYMMPQVVVLESLPLMPNGKVDQKALVVMSEKLTTGDEADYVPPENDLEKRISGAWKESLGLDKIGRDDNFFDLGGTSLDIIRLNIKLKEVFEKDIPVVEMFRYPTIRSFATYLSSSESAIWRREEVLDKGKVSKMRRLQRIKEMKNE